MVIRLGHAAIWSIIGPTISAGETYRLDPMMSETDALAYWMSPDKETSLRRTRASCAERRCGRSVSARRIEVEAGRTEANSSNALACFIGPLKLYRVSAQHLRLPRADVADFAVRIIIPARAGNGVGDRLAQFVRACRSQGVR
jgi:hypothetical protein